MNGITNGRTDWHKAGSPMPASLPGLPQIVAGAGYLNKAAMIHID